MWAHAIYSQHRRAVMVRRVTGVVVLLVQWWCVSGNQGVIHLGRVVQGDPGGWPGVPVGAESPAPAPRSWRCWRVP
jgi:hypothetical protein